MWLWFLILGVVNIPLYVLLWKFIFDDWDDFVDSVRFWFTPDFFSLLRGEYWEDWWAEAKLWTFLALCGGAVFGEYLLIQRMLGNH